MDEWRKLEQEVSGIRVAWVGGLFWELPPEQLETFAVEHAAWGYDIRRVERGEVERIETRLATPPEFALHVPTEGAVEPLAATQTLLAAAQGLGATVIANNPVRALNLSAGHIVGVETDTGRLDADEVVAAGGIGTASLVATAGLTLPMTASPALLVGAKLHTKCLNGLVILPAMQLRQTAEGRLVAAAGFDDADPDADGAVAAAALFDAMKGMIASGASLFPDFHVVGRRPIPKDGSSAPFLSGLLIETPGSRIGINPCLAICAATSNCCAAIAAIPSLEARLITERILVPKTPSLAARVSNSSSCGIGRISWTPSFSGSRPLSTLTKGTSSPTDTPE
jgi:glycine/D-amino acid oxidase-like deaminating enzyme